MSFFNRQPAEQFDAPTSAVENISGDYTIDPTHSRIGFSTRHAMVTTVRGHFEEFAGTARVDTENPASSRVELTIKTSSIDTGVADREPVGDLRQPALPCLARRHRAARERALLDDQHVGALVVRAQGAGGQGDRVRDLLDHDLARREHAAQERPVGVVAVDGVGAVEQIGPEAGADVVADLAVVGGAAPGDVVLVEPATVGPVTEDQVVAVVALDLVVIDATLGECQ